MKIAMVSEHASPLVAPGGEDAGKQNVHIAALSRELAQQGHCVTVYTRRDSPDLPPAVRLAPGVTVEHVPAGPARLVPPEALMPSLPAFSDYLAERWSMEPPDIVHAHCWMSGLAALSGARQVNRPVVQTFHALGITQGRRRLTGADRHRLAERVRLERAITKTAEAVIATCSGEGAELIHFGAPRRRVHVVPAGVDTSRFCRNGPAAGRKKRGFDYRLLYLGRLASAKGADTVIRAMARIPSTELLIAGGPPADELGSDRDVHRLTLVAKETGVADRVTFLGRIPHEKVPRLIRSADLVVSVPRYEPFGMVPVEAMACGVPVAVSPVGGHLDSVVAGVTGIHVPPGRPLEIAQRIRTLLAAPTQRKAMGIGGEDRARSRFSLERVSRETLTIYNECRHAA